MVERVIGIGGLKGSGKDTVANMLTYLDRVGGTRANFDGWVKQRDEKVDNIIHFARPMKEALSHLFDIPIECFDNRDYKDVYYFNILKGTFIKPENITKYHKEITIEMLGSASLNHWIDIISNKRKPDVKFRFDSEPTTPVIKIRTLMQYYATDVIRHHMWNYVWVNKTMKKIKPILYNHARCYIADVRNNMEYNAIINHSENNIVIFVDNPELKSGEHSSESLGFEYTYKIVNDGTLFNLFYKVLEAYQTINK